MSSEFFLFLVWFFGMFFVVGSLLRDGFVFSWVEGLEYFLVVVLDMFGEEIFIGLFLEGLVFFMVYYYVEVFLIKWYSIL